MGGLPTRRCTVYQNLSLSEKEGVTICKAMGWGLHTPLYPEQIETLEKLAKDLRKWRDRKLSLQSFVDYYLEELHNTN